MRQVIDQLDVRRAQVYVEAIDDHRRRHQGGADIGFQWQGLLGAGGNSRTSAAAPTSPRPAARATCSTPGGSRPPRLSSTSTATVGTATTTVTTPSSILGSGLNLGWVPKINGIYTLAALANFLETNVGGNVLATPNLVALDNEEAKIVIGQNIPLTTGSYASSTGELGQQRQSVPDGGTPGHRHHAAHQAARSARTAPCA